MQVERTTKMCEFDRGANGEDGICGSKELLEAFHRQYMHEVEFSQRS